MPAKKTNPLEQIKKINSAQSLPQAVLLLSPDQVRIKRAQQMMTDHFGLTKTGTWKDKPKRIKLKETSNDNLRKINFQANELSLFSTKQIFLIEQIENITAEKTDILLKIIEAAHEDNYFILTGSSLRSNSRLYKKLAQSKCLVSMPAFNATELQRWILRELKSRKLECDSTTAQLLSTMAMESADRAHNFIDMIELYTNDRSFTKEDLVKLFPFDSNVNEYHLIDEINAGKTAAAELRSYQILKSGKQTFPLLGLLYHSMMNYFLIAKLAANGVPQAEIRRKTGLAPWLFNKHLNVAKRTDPTIWQSKLGYFVNSDSKLKNRSLGDENILSELIVNLSTRG